MNISRIASSTLFGLAFSLTAEASLIMYDGFSPSPAKSPSHFQGFGSDWSQTIKPSASSYLHFDGGHLEPLSLPECFADVPTILPVPGDAGKDAAIRYSFDSTTPNSGAKVLTLVDNCQSRAGELHFRFIFRADQAALDGLSAATAKAPDRRMMDSCGILWSTFDYNHACVTNDSVRFTQNQFVIGTDPGKVADAYANITFCRGFLVSLLRDSWTKKCVVRLHVWGKGATDFVTDVKSIDLIDDVVGGKTYLCHVRIEINHYANGDDRFVGFVQPADDYDPSCGWAGAPLVRSVRADVIGTDGSDLIANVVFQGVNDAKNSVRFDEMGLATAAEDLSLITFNDEKFNDVLAYEGFSCGPGGYAPGTNIAVSAASSGLPSNFQGFSALWSMPYNKSAVTMLGDGNGLDLPPCYVAQGVLSSAGTAIGYGSTPAQGMYVRRPFESGLLALKPKDVLHVRCLIAANATALSNLVRGPDLVGGLITGTPGKQENVNYYGAGIGDCSAQIETNQLQESHAPTLCCRARSCFFTFTKGSDGKIGLYLNLLTEADGTPVAYKIKDVEATFAGTVFCYARIEVGTGTDGKERITAFAEDVTKIADKYAANWIPAEYGQFIEHELISETDYPRHAMAGGKAVPGFCFDEVGLELGKNPIAFAWAKRPGGLLMLFR